MSDDTLRQSVLQMRGDFDALAAEVADLGTALDTTIERVVDLSKHVGQGGGGSPAGAGEEVNGYSARSTHGEAHLARLTGLLEWLEWANPTLLAHRSPSSTAIPDCWQNHAGVVEELLALHAAWQAAYGGDAGDAMINWHDRWVEPCLTRVLNAYELSACIDDKDCTIERAARRRALDAAADASNTQPTPVLYGVAGGAR